LPTTVGFLAAFFVTPPGEFCCGQGDCFLVPPDQVSMIGTGYRLFGAEVVPFSETQPSPDGAFWRCKRPDGSRRLLLRADTIDVTRCAHQDRPTLEVL
jgi:hypothetical protein